MAENHLNGEQLLEALKILKRVAQVRDVVRADLKRKFDQEIEAMEEELKDQKGRTLDEQIADLREKLLAQMTETGVPLLYGPDNDIMAEVRHREQIVIEDEAAVIGSIRTLYPQAVKTELRKAEFNRYVKAHADAVFTIHGWRRDTLPVLVVTQNGKED